MLICSLILSCLLEVCGELRSVSGAGLGSGVLNRRIPQHTCPRSPGSLEEAEILGDGPEVLLSELWSFTEECMKPRNASDLFGAKLCLGKVWVRKQKGYWGFSSLGLPLSLFYLANPSRLSSFPAEDKASCLATCAFYHNLY